MRARETLRGLVFLLIALLIVSSASGQSAGRYAELRRVIDRNTGFAHFTRGVNMYTLYALRGCVTQKDVPVLAEMLKDRDRITRMAVADVLVDLGKGGSQVVESRLNQTKDAAEKMMLQDALN